MISLPKVGEFRFFIHLRFIVSRLLSLLITYLSCFYVMHSNSSTIAVSLELRSILKKHSFLVVFVAISSSSTQLFHYHNYHTLLHVPLTVNSFTPHSHSSLISPSTLMLKLPIASITLCIIISKAVQFGIQRVSMALCSLFLSLRVHWQYDVDAALPTS